MCFVYFRNVRRKKTVSLASIELKYFLVLIYYKSTEDYKNEQSQCAEIWTENYLDLRIGLLFLVPLKLCVAMCLAQSTEWEQR